MCCRFIHHPPHVGLLNVLEPSAVAGLASTMTPEQRKRSVQAEAAARGVPRTYEWSPEVHARGGGESPHATGAGVIAGGVPSARRPPITSVAWHFQGQAPPAPTGEGLRQEEDPPQPSKVEQQAVAEPSKAEQQDQEASSEQEEQVDADSSSRTSPELAEADVWV